jgi:hypothetical protein
MCTFGSLRFFLLARTLGSRFFFPERFGLGRSAFGAAFPRALLPPRPETHRVPPRPTGTCRPAPAPGPAPVPVTAPDPAPAARLAPDWTPTLGRRVNARESWNRTPTSSSHFQARFQSLMRSLRENSRDLKVLAATAPLASPVGYTSPARPRR